MAHDEPDPLRAPPALRGDHGLAWLAARQAGVASTAQAAACGLGRGAVTRRVARGWLHRVDRGVVAVGHAGLGYEGRAMAAVLARAPGAAIGLRSAWRMLGIVPPAIVVPDVIDVVVAGRNPGPGGGTVRLHRTARWLPGDVRRIGPVPVTSPARTVLDAALVEPDDVLERLVAHALRRRLTTVEQLRARALAEPGRRGTGRLLGVLADGPAFDRSVAERLTLELVRRARLAEPRLNQRIGPWEVDLLWRRERVVGEFDSYRFHQDRHAFRKDRRKLAALQLEGYRVVTVIWEDLHDHREALAALLARFVAPR